MNNPNGDSNLMRNDSTSSSGKRKRSTSIDESNPIPRESAGRPPTGFSQRLHNALPLLRKADQAPSILNHPLTLNGEPGPKRLKYDIENAEANSISARIESKLYPTPEALLQDVDAAARSLVQDLETRDTPADPGASVRALNQTNLFKQSLGKVCRHIMSSEARVKPEGSLGEETLPEASEDIMRPAVLTLTSQTDRGPKPLYSGLQRRNCDSITDRETFHNQQAMGVPGLEPRGLPSGISATEVASSNVFDQAGLAKQNRTIGEVFRPHPSLKSLEPPRPCRNATRSSSLGWVNDDEQHGTEKPTPVYKSDHRYTSLPTGSWLHYSNAEMSIGRSPDSKRKQRDRALSFGESRPDPPQEALESEQARISALFQSAYSSFAPAYDNSAAVVPEKTRSQAWWNQVGQKRFQALLSLQYPGPELDELNTAASVGVGRAEDEFEAVVAAFEEESTEDPMRRRSEASTDPKEVDDVLQEISDLLHTLSSHQKIRNLSKMSDGPATPTCAESDIYEILRSNLIMLIDSLPPYAVAKLDGDQLQALSVDTNFVVDTKDHVGTLEIDEPGLQRQRAPVAAANSANIRGGVSMNTAGRQGSHSTPSTVPGQRAGLSSGPRTPYTNQPRQMSSHGNTGTPPKPSHSPGRVGQISSQRSGLSRPQHYSNRAYGMGTNAAPFPRPSNTLQNGYGTPYGNANNHTSTSTHATPRHTQSGLSYPVNPSPQRTGDTSRPSLTSEAQHYNQKQRPSPSAAQASPSIPYSTDNPVTMTEQAKAQLQAHRQLAGTPQRLNMNGRYRQAQPTARASTPGGGTPNGRASAVASQGGG